MAIQLSMEQNQDKTVSIDKMKGTENTLKGKRTILLTNCLTIQQKRYMKNVADNITQEKCKYQINYSLIFGLFLWSFKL